jgi:hypothetical protein
MRRQMRRIDDEHTDVVMLQFSDWPAPCNDPELLFCVTDTSVTLAGRPGGPTDA